MRSDPPSSPKRITNVTDARLAGVLQDRCVKKKPRAC